MKKIIGLVLCLLLISLCAFALADVAIDETNFPDQILRDYAASYDYDEDGKLNDEELSRVTVLYLYSEEYSLSDARGIEFFTAAKLLDISENQLISLDISRNTSLEECHCEGNRLQSINSGKVTTLLNLACSRNQLAELDVSQNTGLTSLYCNQNQLTALDISNNTSLKTLFCYSNKLQELDVSNVPALNKLVQETKPIEKNGCLEWSVDEDNDGKMDKTLKVDQGVRIITDKGILEEEQLVSSITLSKSKATLTRASNNKKPTLQLTATVEPENADDPSIEWTSSNPKVAKVDENGKVTALEKGTAVITCTARDGSGVKAECKITVKDKLVSKITLNKKKVTIKLGKTFQLKVTKLSPANALNQKVTWKSSNTKIATVDKNGKVKAKKKGTCTITCTAKDGSGKKVTCKITVK